MNWSGKVCVITGASSGFGRAAARRLAAKGAVMVAMARREERLRSLIEEIGGTPHSYVVCDVSDLSSVREAATEIGRRAGRVDILINNAGIASAGGVFEATSEEMEKVIRTNLLGTIWTTREMLTLLDAAERGARTPVVVNVASMAGRLPVPRSADYTASKFGVVGFTEAMSHDLVSSGIRTMMVLPGLADTEGFPMDRVKANPMASWTVMEADRVVAAMIRGIEAGSFEVRVQWWLTPLYHVSVAMGPLRRVVSGALRNQFRGRF